MVLKSVQCPFCGSDNVFNHGHDKRGKRRYRCTNPECSHKTFVENYTNNGYDIKIRMKVLILTVNGNGTRAISRSLGISQNTVTAILRSVEKDLWYVNYNYLEKNHQIWLWWAIDHNAGDVLALFPKLGTRYVVRYF